MEPIHLFLSPAQGAGDQTLASGLDPSALACVDDADLTRVELEVGRPQRYCFSGDPNSLYEQGWAVIVPNGGRGDKLLDLIRPLLDKRAADMDGEPIGIFRVPSAMTAREALEWYDHVWLGNRPDHEIALYIMVLGDFHEVSIDTQRALATDRFVGRLAFDNDRDYESYIDKLLRWESTQPADHANALFFVAPDETPATVQANRLFMQPLAARVREMQDRGRFPVGDILEIADGDPGRAGDRLLAAASGEGPGVLLSVAHGMGAPRGGWAGHDEQIALQGALCLGRGEYIDGASLGETPFLPGGMWILHGSFGAGTLDTTGYARWLMNLNSQGQFPGDLDSFMAPLSNRERPFVAALPSAALANPDGPLAVIGQVDLSWSHSLQENHRRFSRLLQSASRGDTAGVTLSQLLDALGAEIHQHWHELHTGALSDDRAALGHCWMLYQARESYVLLGDPAARLAVAPKKPGRRS